MANIEADYNEIDSFGAQFNNSQDAGVGNNVGHASKIKKSVESIWSELENMQYSSWNGKMYRDVCAVFESIKSEFEKIINATVDLGNDAIEIAKLYRNVDDPDDTTETVTEERVSLDDLSIVIEDTSAPLTFLENDYESEMSLIIEYMDQISNVISKAGTEFEKVTWNSTASESFLGNRIANYSSNCGTFMQKLKTDFTTFKDDFKETMRNAEKSSDISE